MGDQVQASANELALQVVSQLVRAAIEAKIPGDTYEYAKGGANAVEISKTKILRTAMWMIGKTNSFNTSVMFNFRYGEAPAVALILSEILRGVAKQLYEMNEKGLATPCITSGSYNDLHYRYILMSDLKRDHTRVSKDHVTTIHIYGENLQVVQLSEIVS